MKVNINRVSACQGLSGPSLTTHQEKKHITFNSSFYSQVISMKKLFKARKRKVRERDPSKFTQHDHQITAKIKLLYLILAQF